MGAKKKSTVDESDVEWREHTGPSHTPESGNKKAAESLDNVGERDIRAGKCSKNNSSMSKKFKSNKKVGKKKSKKKRKKVSSSDSSSSGSDSSESKVKKKKKKSKSASKEKKKRKRQRSVCSTDDEGPQNKKKKLMSSVVSVVTLSNSYEPSSSAGKFTVSPVNSPSSSKVMATDVLSSTSYLSQRAFPNTSNDFYYTPNTSLVGTPIQSFYSANNTQSFVDNSQSFANSSSSSLPYQKTAPSFLPEDFLKAGGKFVLSEHQKDPPSVIHYYPDFLQPQEADDLFNILLSELDWQQRETQIRGEFFKEPRLTCWFGVPYVYSGVMLEANHVWHPKLAELKDRLANYLNGSFNSLLCNLYRSGRDSIGWHADDEPSLDRYPLIASMSLGYERQFEVRTRRMQPPFHLNPIGRHLAVPLKHGSLLVMEGGMQVHWLHSVPKDTTAFRHHQEWTHDASTSRINLTFRYTHEEVRRFAPT